MTSLKSYHNYGLAIDVVDILNGAANWNTNWSGISQIGKAQGFSWGVDWSRNKDRPHFEMSFGNSTSTLSQKPLLNNGFRKLR